MRFYSIDYLVSRVLQEGKIPKENVEYLLNKFCDRGIIYGCFNGNTFKNIHSVGIYSIENTLHFRTDYMLRAECGNYKPTFATLQNIKEISKSLTTRRLYLPQYNRMTSESVTLLYAICNKHHIHSLIYSLFPKSECDDVYFRTLTRHWRDYNQ